MIIKLFQEDQQRVLDFMNANHVKYEKYASPFDSFLKSEIEECENVFSDVLGDYTLTRIALEVEEDLSNEEIDLVSEVYNDKANYYKNVLSSPTIAVATITNTLGLQMKEYIYGITDKVIVCYSNDVYESDVLVNEEEEEYILIGEMEVMMQDFLKI